MDLGLPKFYEHVHCIYYVRVSEYAISAGRRYFSSPFFDPFGRRRVSDEHSFARAKVKDDRDGRTRDVMRLHGIFGEERSRDKEGYLTFAGHTLFRPRNERYFTRKRRCHISKAATTNA